MTRILLFAIAMWLVPSWPCYGAEGTLAVADRAWIDRVAGVRPSPPQLAWQQREIEVMICFGVNTFTGSEWATVRKTPRFSTRAR